MSATTQELATLDTTALVPVEVFAPGGVKALLGRVAEEVRGVPVDISTAKGREALKSLVYRITRSKTALDKMGKDLTDEWRARTDAVNAERRFIRAELDALGEEVRRPLTEWEDADKARVDAHEAALAEIRMGREWFATKHTVAEIDARLAHLRAYPRRDWQEFAQRAMNAMADEIEVAQEAREEAVHNEQQEAAYAAAMAESIEQERREAETLRLAREAAIAANATAAAEQAAAAQLAAAEARAAKAEADREAAIANERRRAADAAADAEATEAVRIADRALRAKVNRAAAEALIAMAVPENMAVQIITAIVRGDVPNVGIRY